MHDGSVQFRLQKLKCQRNGATIRLQLTTPRLLISGVINWDTTLFVDRMPVPGEELRVRHVVSGPGGKGANTAASAAGILGSFQVGIIGGVGTDEIAIKQFQILKDEGIDTSCVIQQENLTSGQAYIVVDRTSGENIILTSMSANELKPESLVKEIQSSDGIISKQISSSEAMVIIDPPFEIAEMLAKRANAENKPLILSTGLLSQRGLTLLKNYLLRAEIIILNESEVKAIVATSTADAVESGSQLSKLLDGKKVVVTLGKRGCMFFADGKRTLIPALDLHYFGLKVVNTVGAGDTFMGTFAAFRIEGRDEIESLFLANIAAGLKTIKEETRGIIDKDTILKYSTDQRMRSAFDSIRLS